MNLTLALPDALISELADRVVEKVLERLPRETPKPPLIDGDMIDWRGALLYTRKSLSNLNKGVISSEYPAPVTQANAARRWNRNDWEAWARGKWKRKENANELHHGDSRIQERNALGEV